MAFGCCLPTAASDPTPLPRVPGELTPLAALEDAILPALRRPPCIVAFSGGRDSSAVLAAAASVARRESLPLPIPVSLRFRSAPAAVESGWQEAVVARLRLKDWERPEFSDQLDFLGPVARERLGQHGLYWPANLHFQMPLLERAGNGSLLTGLDGDNVFGGWRWSWLGDLLAGRRPPRWRDVLHLGLAVAPRPVKRSVRGRRLASYMPMWLRPAARLKYRQMLLDTERGPLRWSAHLAGMTNRRYLEVGLGFAELFAGDAGAQLAHPLLDHRFLAAFARAGGSWGWGDRTATMRAVFRDLLPAETIARPTKARFDEAFWGRASREFAHEWDGTGVDPEMVDPVMLRAEWMKDTPHAGSATLLQHLWLRAQSTGKPAGQH